MTSIGDSTSHTLWRVEGHNMLWFQAAWGYHGNMDEKQWGYIYPLVICYTTMENHHAFHGKNHFKSMVIFHSYVTNYQRG
jgi:hypothetical protein